MIEVIDIIYPEDDLAPEEDRVIKELIFHIPDSKIVVRQPLKPREVRMLINALQNPDEASEPVTWGPEHDYFREEEGSLQ